MGTDIVYELKAKYEAQAGNVCLAEEMAQALEIVRQLLSSDSLDCVALGESPSFLLQPLNGFCENRGIRVLAPPFAAESLPHLLDEAQIGITMATFGIAETGTIRHYWK